MSASVSALPPWASCSLRRRSPAGSTTSSDPHHSRARSSPGCRTGTGRRAVARTMVIPQSRWVRSEMVPACVLMMNSDSASGYRAVSRIGRMVIVSVTYERHPRTRRRPVPSQNSMNLSGIETPRTRFSVSTCGKPPTSRIVVRRALYGRICDRPHRCWVLGSRFKHYLRCSTLHTCVRGRRPGDLRWHGCCQGDPPTAGWIRWVTRHVRATHAAWQQQSSRAS